MRLREVTLIVCTRDCGQKKRFNTSKAELPSQPDLQAQTQHAGRLRYQSDGVSLARKPGHAPQKHCHRVFEAVRNRQRLVFGDWYACVPVLNTGVVS
jgi:hypothetical protein